MDGAGAGAGADQRAHRVAVIAPLYPPASRGGGPIRSVHAMTALRPSDVLPFVMTGDRDLGADEALPVTANAWSKREGVSVYFATARSPRWYWAALLALRREHPDVIHLNSFMNPLFSIVPALLWVLGFWGEPILLLAPRGEFGRGALSRRATKKRAYIALFRLLGTHRKVVWHSTSAEETESIRELWGQEVSVVERTNDTLLPVRAVAPTDSEDEVMRAVFLGRIVEHKGLSIVLEALADVRNPLLLDVHGAREDEQYFQRCQDLAGAMPPHVRVTFHHPVAPDNVLNILGRYDALLMPTAGENFGHVIAEALSRACVVVTTPFTPWTADLRSGGGVVVDDRSPRSWAAAIDDLAGEGPMQRHRRRVRAGDVYDKWAARPKGSHVWTLTLEHTRRGATSPKRS